MGKGGQSVTQSGSDKQVKKITVEELSKHRTMDDAWISYKGKVYDVSNWLEHPGTSFIVEF
jgi:cytochrome b involved in lipid metabolism